MSGWWSSAGTLLGPCHTCNSWATLSRSCLSDFTSCPIFWRVSQQILLHWLFSYLWQGDLNASYKYLQYSSCNRTYPQCFDAVGWVTGRASSLLQNPLGWRLCELVGCVARSTTYKENLQIVLACLWGCSGYGCLVLGVKGATSKLGFTGKVTIKTRMWSSNSSSSNNVDISCGCVQLYPVLVRTSRVRSGSCNDRKSFRPSQMPPPATVQAAVPTPSS